jgi:hypothetical protein
LPPPPDNLSRPESSSRPQNPKALPSFGTIMPIIGGSAMEFETKRQSVVWTSLGPLPRWVPGPTTRWAPGTTRLAVHGI